MEYYDNMQHYTDYYPSDALDYLIPPFAHLLGLLPKHPALQHQLISYYSLHFNIAPYKGTQKGYLSSIGLPDILTGIIYIAGDDFCMTNVDGTSTLLRTGNVYILPPQKTAVYHSCPSGTNIHIMGIELPAEQLFYLFDIPLHELVNQVIHYRNIAPHGADELCALLHAFPYSLHQLDCFLVNSSKHKATHDPVLAAGIESIIHHKGLLKIKDLATYLNVDRRTLIKDFKYFLNTTPGKFIRNSGL